jgi:phosphohistidine phosphatase SixA
MPGAGRLAGVALAVAIAVTACGGGGAGDDRPAPAAATAQGTSFLQTLRGGGNVIVFRHAITDRSHPDEARFRFDQCARQRNLSAAGRAQARAIGRDIRALGIPIGRVLASPYCRTRETARLAFGRVTATRDLLPRSTIRRIENAGTLDERFRALLRRAPARGTNTVLVSHDIAIDAATGVNPDEGDAAVFRRDGSRRGFRLLRRMTAAEWTALSSE